MILAGIQRLTPQALRTTKYAADRRNATGFQIEAFWNEGNFSPCFFPKWFYWGTSVSPPRHSRMILAGIQWLSPQA